MAIQDDFTVASNGNIRYVGAAHGLPTAGYYPVIQFHRWLQDLADNASAAISTAGSTDYLDITDRTPSERSTDNIITLINSFNIDQTASEHLYDGSIIQAGGAEIWDGLVVIANQGMKFDLVQNAKVLTNDFWNYRVKGTHTGAANATVLSDSTKAWTTNQWAGYYIYNTTDTSWGVIASNTNTTITLTAAGLQGGTENDWDASDAYKIVAGLNADPVSGYSHRFMVKVRSTVNDNDGTAFTNADGTTTGDIDGKKLLGQTRVWHKTYGEFRIGTGTARGNNVMALTYADDLNNTTLKTVVGSNSGWTTFTNDSVGYNGIDVDNNTVNEFYYSRWNVPTQVDRGAGLVVSKINDLYERIKWLSTTDTAQTLYGVNAALFRGITHEFAYDTETGGAAWTQGGPITWGTGVTAGSGILVASNDTGTAGTFWIQLLTGAAPADNVLITQAASSKTCLVNGTVTERTLSFPHCGASTGSALIGAYGFGVEKTDLTAADKVTDLTATVITPPDNRSFSVTGLATSDYVIVGPESGGTIQLNQFTLATTSLTTDNVTSVIVNTAIPSDTPSTGTIRVADNNGNYRRLSYSSRSGSTFTIDSTDGNEDFTSVNASIGNNVFISYIDTTGVTSAAYSAVYSGSSRSLYVRVRFAGTSGNSYTDSIKTFESPASFPGSSAAIRTVDA